MTVFANNTEIIATLQDSVLDFVKQCMTYLSDYDRLESLSPYVYETTKDGIHYLKLKDEHKKFPTLFCSEKWDQYRTSLHWNERIVYLYHRQWGIDHDTHRLVDLIYFIELAYDNIRFTKDNGKYQMVKLEDTNINQRNETIQTTMASQKVQDIKKLLDNSGQIILQGAPGCGKTYITTELAVYLCDGEVPVGRKELKGRYKQLQEQGRIGFTTFHQSLDYEEFVEGYKPDTKNSDGEMRFVKEDGIFKRICKRAISDTSIPFVLIIDEINRANISKVLGELITLLEKSKRIGGSDEFTVTLPYSGDVFGVPDNLYIIGTMNTADRSLGYIDYAIRRRFAFMTLESDSDVIKKYYHDKGELMNKEYGLYTEVRNLLKRNISDDFDINDVMVGHSYFLAASEEDYDINLNYKIRPLLEEYLRDGIIVDRGGIKEAIKNIGKTVSNL